MSLNEPRIVPAEPEWSKPGWEKVCQRGATVMFRKGHRTLYVSFRDVLAYRTREKKRMVRNG